MNVEPNKVIQASRRIIEHKLLSALDDPDTVAILAGKDDLDLLIHALRHISLLRTAHEHERADFWRRGMEQLRREAFGE